MTEQCAARIARHQASITHHRTRFSWQRVHHSTSMSTNNSAARGKTAASDFALWCRARRKVEALRARLAEACDVERRRRYAAMPSERPLTPKQREVLALVLEGRANKEIAAALLIGERTVKFHVSCLLRIFQAASRRDLIAAIPGEKHNANTAQH